MRIYFLSKWILISLAIFEGVKPNLFATSLPGADSPKVSIPKFNPLIPVYFCQPVVTPASIETFIFGRYYFI